FGHGFSLAGCLLLHLLHQKTHFDLTDLSLSLLRLRQRESHRRQEEVSPSFRRFLSRAERLHSLSQHLFGSLLRESAYKSRAQQY
ncbi:hypothetical protein ELO03_29610, partial [Klebsiella pneumoniae]|nr:hypothetical protein [Klebsiella pneumoniae]